MPTRQDMWTSLPEDVDVFIIGGGINGTGIARDLSRRGLSVAMVDMRDLAFGTSSSSSKLVHGGVRYLEQLEFSLVFESVSERRILLDLAPHLVNPLGFLFPIYKDSRRGLATINAGLWMYEGLSLFRSPKRPRRLRRNDVSVEEPCVKMEDLKGASLYYDCSTDDARLTLENGLDAAAQGASIVTYAKCVGFEKDENGAIVAATVEDQFSGDTKTVRARAFVNASGPWTDETIRINDAVHMQPLLRPTKGVHFVVPRQALPVNNAVVCFHPVDERVMFALPWGDSTYVGTTDTDYEGDPGEVHATEDDIDYLIDLAAAYFPENVIDPKDIICTWAGLRPLMRPAKKGQDIDESAISREHQIIVGEDGLITIAGGKLTTYRRMAEEVADTTVKMLRMREQLPDGITSKSDTENSPLPGAIGWPEDDDHERVATRVKEAANNRIGDDSALLLANTFGMRAMEVASLVATNATLGERILPNRPEIMAQIDFSVHHEFASTIVDMIKQRTQIFYRDADQGLGVVDKVAGRMQELLSWDDAFTERMKQEYREEVALSRRWRQGKYASV